MDSDSLNDPCFMRDQYLELLWAAQRVEDRRLTEMILGRLKAIAYEMTVAPAPACEVIPFPSLIVHASRTSQLGEYIDPLWPRQPLHHLMSMLCGYCGSVFFFALYGLGA